MGQLHLIPAEHHIVAYFGWLGNNMMECEIKKTACFQAERKKKEWAERLRKDTPLIGRCAVRGAFDA